MIVLIEAGCAECHFGDGPLIELHEFETIEAAKVWASEQGWVADVKGHVPWRPHPQGGEHVVVGQGSLWIPPLVTLVTAGILPS